MKVHLSARKKAQSLRGLWWRRTRTAPGFGVCPCEICRSTAAAYSSDLRAERPRFGAPVAGCVYLNRERIFADLWAKEHAWNDLSQLLMSRPLRKGERPGFLWSHGPLAFLLTIRDRVMLATLVQWLGTNVGFDFVRRAVNACGYELREREELKRRSA